MVGRVVSVKMEKTAVVLIERKKKHPLYGKTYSQSKKYLADDPFGVKDGDIVILHKIAPMSKRKHWRISKVLGQDYVSLQQAELQEAAIEAIEEVMPEDRNESDEISVSEDGVSVDKQSLPSDDSKGQKKTEKPEKKTRVKKEKK